MVLTTELKILAFIRSLREGNFEAYKEAIIALLPYFSSNDNIHYSRWLTLHIIDMLVLEKKFPDVHEQFQLKYLSHLNFNLYAPLTRNKFSLFETSKIKQTKEHDKLKDDYNLFSNLCVSCQTRQVDLDEFFKYENQIAPAALSSHGELYKTNKADLLTCLETSTTAESVQPVVDSIAIDGSCPAHIVKPKALTFKNYTEKNFVGKVTSYASKQKRTDVVFDTYKSNILRSYTRLTRGRGSRRRVTSEGKCPKTGTIKRNCIHSWQTN